MPSIAPLKRRHKIPLPGALLEQWNGSFYLFIFLLLNCHYEIKSYLNFIPKTLFGFDTLHYLNLVKNNEYQIDGRILKAQSPCCMDIIDIIWLKINLAFSFNS